PPVEGEATRVTPQTGAGSPLPGPGAPGDSPGQGTPGAYGDRGQYIPWSSNAITSDSMRVGTYGQPAWTTQRPFPTTRVYVQPEGTYQLEQWARPTWAQKCKRATR